MRMLNGSIYALLVIVPMTVGQVWAASSAAPHKLVQQSVSEVLAVVRSIDDADDITAQDVEELLAVLEPVVAFDAIAQAVVGSHGSELSASQQSSFSEKFKRTMTRFYLESMVTFGINDVSLHQPDDFDPSSSRTRVRMNAVDGSGNSYEIAYTMLQSEGEWQMQNMIVDGVNVGLTYRNQFDSAMATNNGRPEQVISNWEQFIE